MNNNKHLTLDNRYTIEQGLNQRLSFKAIGLALEKDCTTISKEVRNHLVFQKTGVPYRPFNDCLNRKNCKHNGDGCNTCVEKNKTRCFACGVCCTKNHCPDYQREVCPRLLKAPYVCNGCPDRRSCTLEKRLYHAKQAQKEYEATRSEARSGFNLTEDERAHLDSIISPLLKNGQSLHHILVNNADSISCCAKTAYIYADNGLFHARNIDMPRKVRFRPRKAKSVELKVDKACRIGRTFEDFKQFCKENPTLPVVQLDSVEGIKGGAVLLTIHFVLPRLQLAFCRESNDSKSVIEIFDRLYKSLGKDLYRELFPILLADNGTEFSNPKALEFDKDGNQRSHVFYCNPSAPNQKGACEVNHEFIGRIIPKGVDIGNYSPEQIHLMMDHINSYGRPEMKNKSPYDAFEFYYDKTALDKLGIHKIPANEIILKPELLIKHKATISVQ